MRKLLSSLFLLLLFVSNTMAQERTVTGTVKGKEDGLPLPGVSVRVKGTKDGTQTGVNGQFSVKVAGSNAILVFTYIGYTTQEVPVGARGLINVTLLSDAKQLGEVVITGYGSQVKREFTGSTTTIGAEKVENRPLPAVDQILQGQVAGLQSVGGSGQPGALQSVRIRGIGSINAGSDPLYVVDGVIINAGDFSRNTASSSQLAGINPNDIENVSVLKDASAISIYGSRGANGVIIINTKKGISGRTKLNFSTEVGQTDIARNPDAGKPLNATEWLELTREGLLNAGETPSEVDASMRELGEGSGVNTDWIDVVTRTGKQQNYNLSAQGGNEKTKFFVSGGFFNQEAPVIASSLKRYTGNFNLDHQINSKISFGANLMVSYLGQKTPPTGGSYSNPYGSAYFLMPTQNPYNADGSLNINRTGTLDFGGNFNPLYIAENDKRDARNAKAIGSVNATWDIIKGLKFNTRVGIDYFNLEEQIFFNPYHGDGRTVNGRGYNYYTRIFNWITTNQLTYQFAMPGVEDLRVNATLGYEAQKSMEYDVTTNTTGYPPTTALPSSIVAATPVTATGTGTDYSFNAILSSLNLTYKGKYNLSGTLRRDGSSRFGSKNPYGTFWSVGAGWNISEEEFMKDITVISLLKLRSSYGVNGNASIGNYIWRPTFGYGINYNQQPGGAFNNIGNVDLTWEQNKPFNIGIDLGLLKDRITFNVDYYVRTTSKLLFNQATSSTIGFTSKPVNIGEMQNKGFEFTIGGRPIDGKFRWSTNFNIAFNKNKVTSLPNGADQIDGAFIMREGYDFRTYYVRQYAGVDSETGAPLWYTDDTKTTTTNAYSLAARYPYKSATPKAFGGFNNTFSYKGITLDALLVFNFGNYVRDSWEAYMMDGVNPLNNKYRKQLDRWQKPGDQTNVPKYVYGLQNSASSFSTRFLYKGDFIRLRNITLGYDLKKEWINKIGIQSANIYLRGTNLLTKIFDDELTSDPEQGVNSTSNFNIPQSRSFTLGLNVNF